MARTRTALLAAIAALLVCAPSLARESFVLVGGGPMPRASQVSIEKNAIWIENLMAARPFTTRQVLFAAGAGGKPDVVWHAPEGAEVQRWLPLARIFGQQKEALSLFRPNAVPGNSGAITVEAVDAALRSAVAPLGEGDGLFFVYSGHGSYQPGDTSRNALRLWGESRLDVRHFGDILSSVHPGAAVRFVLPQCFSGAFARSIARDVIEPRAAEIETNRCGFVSVSDDVVAEGCTPGVDIGEYRDYSTFFFAALAGHERSGGPLRRDPDADRDGRVSLGEAHAYAYTEGLSADVPRATSEYYLELWEPWTARWQSAVPLAPGNEFLARARRLAENAGLAETEPAALARRTLHERRRLEARIEAAREQIDRARADEKRLRHDLRTRFDTEWPAVSHPWTAAYAAFLQEAPGPALDWIRAQPDYARLAALQDRIDAEEMAMLELRREAARFARIHRALQLASTREQFERLADPRERDTYAALAQCESWSPPEAPRP